MFRVWRRRYDVGVDVELELSTILLGALIERLPLVGEELVEPAVGPARAERREEIGEVSSRLESVGFGGNDEGQHAGEALSAALGPGKEPRFSAGSDAAKAPFGFSVVDLEP